jgi:hypothetical protein
LPLLGPLQVKQSELQALHEEVAASKYWPEIQLRHCVAAGPLQVKQEKSQQILLKRFLGEAQDRH